MADETQIPKFKNEAEEAAWWFEHQDLLLTQFQKAAEDGSLGRGRAVAKAQSAPTPTTTIRLDPVDIERARIAAAKRGLKYQTYLKMIIHEALEKETAA